MSLDSTFGLQEETWTPKTRTLGFILKMVCFLLLRPNLIICKYVVKNGFLSDWLFASGKSFLGLDDLATKSLGPISMFFAGVGEGSRPAGIRGELSFEAGLLLRANQA